MNKENAMSIIKELDKEIDKIIENNYNSFLENKRLKNLKFNDKASVSLKSYLFSKIKIEVYGNLLSGLLLLDDLYNKRVLNQVIDITAPTLLAMNCISKKEDESLTKALQKSTLSKQNDNLENKLKKIDDSFKRYRLSGIDRSSPYIYFISIIKESFNYNFFFRDYIFCYKKDEDYRYLYPIHFLEYITTIVHMMYTSTAGKTSKKGKRDIKDANNLIKRCNTILAYIDKKDTFKEYKKFKDLFGSYNQNIDDIKNIQKSLEKDELKYYSYYYLLNRYLHNNFILGISHPFIKIIMKRIDFNELYDEAKNDTSSYFNNPTQWKNITDEKKLIDCYSVKESIYHLHLLELIMEYDINFNSIKEDIFEYKDTIFEGNRYDFLREQEQIFELTISFLYDTLETAKNEMIQYISSIQQSLFNYYCFHKNTECYSYFYEILLKGIKNAFSTINENAIFQEVYPEKKDYDEIIEPMVKKHPYLFAYLIKQGFYSHI